MILPLLFLFLSFQAFAVNETPAQEALPVIEKVEEAAAEVKQKVSGTSFYREHSKHTALLGYEFLSTWIPFKFTASYTYIFNKKWSVEAEFARGHFGAGVFGFDLASVTEYRYSVLARRYTGNSFHWIFGLHKTDFRGKIGSDILDDMTDTSVDDFKASAIGATVGLGNRWQWQKGFTLGIDWFRMSVPLFAKKRDDGLLKNIGDSSDRRTVRSGINKITNIPTFVLMGISLGYTF